MSTPEMPKHVPPVPQYGEYAPTAPPQQSYPAPAAPQPPTYTPMASHQQPNYAQQGYGSQGYYDPNAPRPVRTGDMIASVVLLVLGGLSVLYALFNALTLNIQMEAIYDQYGLEYEAGPGGAIAAAVLVISHLVLYAIAVIFTIVLIRKRRISFWLPLTIGVVATIIFFATIMVLAFSDPALLQAATEQSSPYN